MQLAKTNSKKWVDYSDSSEEQQQQRRPSISPPSKNKPSTIQTPILPSTQPEIDTQAPDFLQSQLKRFEQCGPYKKEFWLSVVSKDQVFLDKKMFQLKGENNSDIMQIEISEQLKGAWNVRVRRSIVEKWLREGIDQDKKIKVIVSLKNIRNKDQKKYDNRERNGQRGQRRERGDRRNGGERRQRGERGQRGQRGDRRGRGRRDNNGENRNQQGGQRRRRDRDNREGGQQKKKVYVDKVTGKPPTNKLECQTRLIEQKERHYTRSEAEKMGMQLGNFRTKSKVEPKPNECEVQKVEAKQQPIKEIKPKEEAFEKKPKQVSMWTRKQRSDKPAQQESKVKPKYAEKQSKFIQKGEQAGQTKETEKKKKYVRVDQKPEQQRKPLKYKSNQETATTEQPKRTQKSFLEEDN